MHLAVKYVFVCHIFVNTTRLEIARVLMWRKLIKKTKKYDFVVTFKQ